MELQFQNKEIPWLQNVLEQVQNLEQTQELRIPEGMDGAARILGCWGQVLLRGKEWNREEVSLSGGVQVWVLYESEEDAHPCRLETWIPFRMDWSLPADTPEGTIRFSALLRFSDARVVSAGKLLIRVGVGVLAQCWVPGTGLLSTPEQVPEDVELLRNRWPVQLPKEAGEKTFELREQLALPPAAPQPETLIYSRLVPAVSDRKVLGNKLVFRGAGQLHVLCQCQGGQLYSWDFELPFSQFVELGEGRSADAQADVLVAVTSLETELKEDGSLQLNASLTAQYLVDDREILETVEDAYSLRRELSVQHRQLHLPVLLDSRRESGHGEQTISMQADVVADVVFLPDFPQQRREEDTVVLEQCAQVQLLCYDAQGKLQGATQRMEGTHKVQAGEGSRLTVVPLVPSQLQVLPGSNTITLHSEFPLQLLTQGGEGMEVVTGLQIGEIREPDPQRPSLILQRAENRRLWDIARQSGSTVAAIQKANGLEGEPEPNRMLLIPVV